MAILYLALKLQSIEKNRNEFQRKQKQTHDFVGTEKIIYQILLNFLIKLFFNLKIFVRKHLFVRVKFK